MTAAARPWHGPPLALQIGALLLGVLMVAQLVTLALTLLLPPAPQAQYQLDDIAGLLAGKGVDARAQRPLQRQVQLQPPDPTGPGWLTSEASRSDLARLLGVHGDQVRLYFYTPLPFAGAASPLPQPRVFRETAAAPLRPVVAHATEPVGVASRLLVPVSQAVGGQGPGPAPHAAAGIGRAGMPGGGPPGDVVDRTGSGVPGAASGQRPAQRPHQPLQSAVPGLLPPMTLPPVTTLMQNPALRPLTPVSPATATTTTTPVIPMLLPPAAAASPLLPPTGRAMATPAPDAPHPTAAAATSADMPERSAFRSEAGATGAAPTGAQAVDTSNTQLQAPTQVQMQMQAPLQMQMQMQTPWSGPGPGQGPSAVQATDAARPAATPATPLLASPMTPAVNAAAAAAQAIAAALPPTWTAALAPQQHPVDTLVPDDSRPRRSGSTNAASPTAPAAVHTPEALPAVVAQPMANLVGAAPAVPVLQSAAAHPDAAPLSTVPAAAVRPAPDADGLQTVRGLLGLAPAPFVVGDFVAGVQLPSGGWAVVQPTPEPFPNAWQRRVLLWFAVALLLVAPLAWFFSRRLVRPITSFARAAEQLGRDPSATISPLDGPAEVGRAAHAFNIMQSRLRSFIDDRTTMIGAISHDLRTPLTRMRFRIEDAPDALRDGMLNDVQEMEAMINSVLAFIRDASDPGARERLDLLSIVEDVVEDAVFVGKSVVLDPSVVAEVEVDAIAMRRLLSNLIDNAVKYGDRAEVRLFTDRQFAIVEVSDHGKGLPDDELERVFQPFYRAPDAVNSAKSGSGLGLAVCRSIARAHGGDVNVRVGQQGLVAQVRLPLALMQPAAPDAAAARPPGLLAGWLQPVTAPRTRPLAASAGA